MAPKTVLFHFRDSFFWLPFRDLFRRSTFGCILVPLWLTFGSLLAPFGSLLPPFGSLLGHFGSPLAHFWSPLAHFWCPRAHFCSPWRSIFSLLGSPGVIFALFFEFPTEILCKIRFVGKCSLKSRSLFFWGFETLSANTRRQYQGP